MSELDDAERVRAKRLVEVAYAVRGVVAVRVWREKSRFAVGVRGGEATTPSDLVARVESALAGVAHAGEVIDVGLLGDDSAANDADESDA